MLFYLRLMGFVEKYIIWDDWDMDESECFIWGGNGIYQNPYKREGSETSFSHAEIETIVAFMSES